MLCNNTTKKYLIFQAKDILWNLFFLKIPESWKRYLCIKHIIANTKNCKFRNITRAIGFSRLHISHQSMGKIVKAKEILRGTYEIQYVVDYLREYCTLQTHCSDNSRKLHVQLNIGIKCILFLIGNYLFLISLFDLFVWSTFMRHFYIDNCNYLSAIWNVEYYKHCAVWN